MNSTATVSARLQTAESRARDALADSLRQIVDEAEQWMKVAQADGSATIDSVRSRMEDRLRQARADLSAHANDALDQARRAASNTDDAIRANPYAAIGIAAGVALAVGVLIARR